MTLLRSYLVPYSIPPRDLCCWNTGDYSSPLGNQLIGLGMLLDDLLDVPKQQVCQNRSKNAKKGVSEVKNDKDKFQVMLDVSQFRPEELSVKTVDDFIVVQGKHEEKQDEHGFIQREFVRRYALPDDVEPHKLISSLSPDGYLIVEAPKAAKPPPNNERSVPITMSSAAAINSKNENPSASKDEPTD